MWDLQKTAGYIAMNQIKTRITFSFPLISEVNKFVYTFIIMGLFVVPISALERWRGGWTTSFEGGSQIDIPDFLLNGPIRRLFKDGKEYGISYEGSEWSSLSVQQWLVHDKLPSAYLNMGDRKSIKHETYYVDRGSWAAVSGFTDSAKENGLYLICKLKQRSLVCLRMLWNSEDQSSIVPMIERIVNSFRKQN